MQMLEAGGYPVVGTWPGFEVATRSNARAVIAANPGAAVKLVDPDPGGSFLPRDFDGVVILLRRDWTEQAKSQLKLLAAAGYPASADRKTLRRMAETNHRDWNSVQECLRVRGQFYYGARFDDIVQRPRDYAEKLSLIVGGIDVERAAAAVVERGPECLPYMLEQKQLLRSARHG